VHVRPGECAARARAQQIRCGHSFARQQPNFDRHPPLTTTRLQSATFPFCDGSHKAHNAANGTTFKPKPISNAEGTEPKDFWVCRCAHTKNPPLCDGSHRKVKAVPV